MKFDTQGPTAGIDPRHGLHPDSSRPDPAHARWWERAIIYQIAVMSFQDSNGDGRGDIRGLLQRLDYLAWLGVTAVWLPPVYPSPMLDFGYDIADFCAIDPVYGSLQDFDEFVGALHARDIRLI